MNINEVKCLIHSLIIYEQVCDADEIFILQKTLKTLDIYLD